MDKIDTQGMSAPADPNDKRKWKAQPHKPMEIHPMRLFTPEMVKEAKILINEVLDEREYKRRLRMSYDDVKPLGISYFDTEQFKHRINESEPPYEAWQ